MTANVSQAVSIGVTNFLKLTTLSPNIIRTLNLFLSSTKLLKYTADTTTKLEYTHTSVCNIKYIKPETNRIRKGASM
jgi:hypothetical protein